MTRSFRGGQMRPLGFGDYPGGAYPTTKQGGGGALGGNLSPGAYQKGGDGKSAMRPHGMDSGSGSGSMIGGRRKRSLRKGKRGGNMISTAIVPFGLLGLQQCFGKRSKSKGKRRSSRRRFTQKRR
jgi:hypothetical protein